MIRFRGALKMLSFIAIVGFYPGLGCDDEAKSSEDDSNAIPIDTDQGSGSEDSDSDTCADRDCEEDTELTEVDQLSCQGIVLCGHCCLNPGPCFRACEDLGGEENTARKVAMYDCLEASGCKSDSCVEEACGEQLAACDWNPIGDLSCKELSDCLKTCEPLAQYGGAAKCTETGGLMCINQCFGNADADAIDRFKAYDSCMWKSCQKKCEGYSESQEAADRCNTCLNDQCGSQITACVSDD